jgi:glycosyltransferase involved in cell wall biosynthesis
MSGLDTHRCQASTKFSPKNNLELVLLHSIAYKKNVSVARLINHAGIARQFRELARQVSKPDIVLCSLPTLELSIEAVKYGKDINIPVILDIRDLWPDVFITGVPRFLRFLSRILFHPYTRMLKKACSQATAIIAITDEYVDWGISQSSRQRTPFDRKFPMGYASVSPDLDSIQRAQKFWEDHGVEESDFIICYFGVFSHLREIETVIEAAHCLTNTEQLKYQNIKFVLCGTGPKFSDYKRLSRQNSNIIFPGWIEYPQIWYLMRIAKLGLAPYPSIQNYMKNIPNKPIEYLSAGLPVLSSLTGVLADLMRQYSCGVTYRNGDVSELTEIIKEMYEDINYVQYMSKNAKSLFQEKFMAEKVYGEMIKYLESFVHHE